MSERHDHDHNIDGGHRHLGDNITLPEDGFWAYGPVTSVAVGALHGIGAETPTQVLLLAAAATAGGAAPGIALLGAFLLGLFASNSIVGLTVALGFLRASRNFVVYATISVVTGLAGMTVGALLLVGRATALPALFAPVRTAGLLSNSRRRRVARHDGQPMPMAARPRSRSATPPVRGGWPAAQRRSRPIRHRL